VFLALRSTDFVSVFTLVLLVSPAWFSAAYADSEWRKSIAEDNRDSIVHIVGNGTAANNLRVDMNGTGFIVRSEGYVLTCGHVVPSDCKIETLNACLASHPEVSYPVSVFKRDDKVDLILLRLPTDRFWRSVVGIVSLDDSSVKDGGMDIVAEGFALGINYLSDRPGLLNPPIPEGYWITNAGLDHGMSGGPVFNTSGEVVAIVKGTIEESRSSNVVIPIRQSSELLESIGRQIDEPQKPSSRVVLRRSILQMFRYAVDGNGDCHFPVEDLRTRLFDLRETLVALSERPQTIPEFKAVEMDSSFPDATELEQTWKNGTNILEILGGTLYAKSDPTRVGSTVYLGALRGSLSSPTARVLSAVNAEDYDKPDTLCALTLYAAAMDAKASGAPSTEVQFYLAHAQGALNSITAASQGGITSLQEILAKAIDAEFQKCRRP
jgi:hypothetical protein